ncbi:MAG: uroporphyrinogen decarboxylase family protein [Armatimonadota bacterium]
MTPRENFTVLLEGGSPERIPFTLDVGAIPGFTQAIRRRFEQETGADDPAEYFDYDFRLASVTTHSAIGNPRIYYSDPLPEGTSFDSWGVGHWAGGAEDTYEQSFPPLASISSLAEVEAFPIPTVDVSGVAERVQAFHARGYPVIGYAGSIYEWSWWLRGMDTFMMDLLAEPELARAIITKVAGFSTELALATAAAGVDILAFYDDAGMQTGLQIAPDLWRAFIKPAWHALLTTVRNHYPEAAFFLHSCGDISAIVPDIVELGFDILHPLQPECMDPAAVKREFGDRIIPCATMGAQGCFSFGSAGEVARETLRLIETLGADRRCILCPSNAVQPETPWENILAFAKAARQGVGE